MRSCSIATRSAEPSARMCRWPRNSSRLRGRSRSASGATDGSRSCAASEKRSATRPKYAPSVTEGHGSGHAVEDYSQPVLPGRGESDYERYLRTDELLELQKPAEERAH